MKTLLTLFVLFFSSSVVAGDDLTGKKIFCIQEPNKARNIGFYFESKNKVKMYVSLYSDDIKGVIDAKYNYITKISTIEITNDKKDIYFIIDREKLEIFDKESKIASLCEIIKIKGLRKHIIDTWKNQVTIIKSKNKL